MERSRRKGSHIDSQFSLGLSTTAVSPIRGHFLEKPFLVLVHWLMRILSWLSIGTAKALESYFGEMKTSLLPKSRGRD